MSSVKTLFYPRLSQPLKLVLVWSAESRESKWIEIFRFIEFKFENDFYFFLFAVSGLKTFSICLRVLKGCFSYALGNYWENKNFYKVRTKTIFLSKTVIPKNLYFTYTQKCIYTSQEKKNIKHIMIKPIQSSLRSQYKINIFNINT